MLIPAEPELTYKGIAAVIADGVSACEDGKVASETCVKSLLWDYYATPDSWSVKHAVEKVLSATNRWLYSHGLASTLSVLIAKSTTGYLFHIGDSRIFRLRGGTLEQLTQDHRWGPGASRYLARALGIDLNLDIDHKTFPIAQGDVFLFTTDGVHDWLAADDLLAIVQNCPDLDHAACEIVRRARAAGSADDLTCQIVRFDKLPLPDEQEALRKLTALPFPPLLEPGMRLDGYRIVREICASPRVQIYQAVDEQTGEMVVLKTPSPNFADDPIYIDLFAHEEWVGSRLKSPHVMQIKKPKVRSCLYLVAEYIPGQTLRQWMDDHPRRSIQEVRVLVSQIAKGLLAFHRLDMLHQDLNPTNVMIDRDGIVKLIDFGSTKIAGVEEIASPLSRIHLLGTRHYAAPEYFLGYAGTQSSDQFSLAVIAYELLTNRLPYGESYGEGSLTRLKYTSARRFNPELPIWMDKALVKALSLNPEHRYKTLSEFVYDLNHPNPSFLRRQEPLIERHPVRFWRLAAALGWVLNLILGLLLIRLLQG
nr:serine/threonine protein kinase [uncultured Gammaproteobacteria bacterium]BAL54427.1 serine/threonine protein kinase [uncultured Gammaproteobacteria bacterium]BAL55756.1 serine/threonine protein kinase [uncultured Gammaproteobacteria bacterium]